ncbi:(2Fe-2S) ferredoxin domain-containing protein [Thermophagus sp. OGC60D27]|uniref:(2Fe-2S) ferredoxin domain-containing protein n=1 Tax=Thermophagus sp. OGC60D27 TaxID=3458415 RepID=UPI004037ABE2
MSDKVKNLQDLRDLRDELKGKILLREKSNAPEKLVQIKVSMATCGIASGARETMNYLIDELDKQDVDAVVTQTGCMGYCYAEPTIEVTLPGEKPVVFGYVDTAKAAEIIDKYIKNGELVDGIIPDTYKTIDNK